MHRALVHRMMGRAIRLLVRLAAGMAVGVVPAVMGAQSVGSTASATIVMALSATKVADLNLGVHMPGAGAVSVSASSAAAGKFIITGTSDVEITFPSSITISNGANTLSVSISARGHATDNQASSTSLSSGSSRSLSANRYHVWFGGSTTVGGAAAPGLYTGTFTITVRYSSD